LANCIFEHEFSHVQDFERDYPNRCKGKPQGLVLYSPEDWVIESECKAYIRSIECLRKQLDESAEGCPTCPEGVLEKELAFHMNQFFFFFKCGERGYSW
jgi:hypothetical protein